MARMTGGEAIVEGLIRHGIDTVFGLPGAQVYGLFDAFARASNRLRLITTRHEQSCAYMALGYAKSTGRPGAYAVVPGPGMLNTTAALATAAGVNAPVLCLTGQVPSAFLGRGRGHLHELPDQLATMRGLVKWADRIEHPSQAPLLVARAFQEMRSGRPGPVALEMPWDQFPAMGEATPVDPLPLFQPATPDGEVVARLAALLKDAKAPMIIAGGGAAHAGAEVLALAELAGAPVVAFRNGRGVVGDRHPLGLTVAAGHVLWPQTDLVIGIGSRMEYPATRWAPGPPGLKTARIDIDPAEMRRYPVDVGIVADAAAGAAALTAALRRLLNGAARDNAARLAAVAAAKAGALEAIRKVQPQMSYLNVLRAVLPDDAFIVDEVCQAGFTATFGFPIHHPRHFVSSGFQGTLGAGFPMALGVKVAHPDTPVVSLTGDGGFLFAGTELATAVQHGINLITVVFNNNAYGNVMRDQKRLYAGRIPGSVLRNPDFQAFAASFGVPSWRVTAPEGFEAALTAALAAAAPCLIEVQTDIDQEASPWEFLVPGRA
ncbi:thiamine pyrophosphate-dependent enzyme [Limobrevibacterium gyesilva]|uniref:Thiamine pyrophosphate-binding protein n=1 Tax=Limobrevibacterium gyesilva TaxID=2991712 RepID=A0AA41YPJ4_9PROT|nr:thiamine pyrophosphate-dependent enzyme [Limobrevibacterium gyesilva]MCW3474145.1 thiamine pyrophosphate-binding protein [Limobrevibacterium gyesilva]